MWKYRLFHRSYSNVVPYSPQLPHKQSSDSLAQDEQVQPIRCSNYHLGCSNFDPFKLSYHWTRPRMAWLSDHHTAMVLHLRHRSHDDLYCDLGDWASWNHSRKRIGYLKTSSQGRKDGKWGFHRRFEVGRLTYTCIRFLNSCYQLVANVYYDRIYFFFDSNTWSINQFFKYCCGTYVEIAFHLTSGVLVVASSGLP